MERETSKKVQRRQDAFARSNAVTNKMTAIFCALVVLSIFFIKLSQDSAFELWFMTKALLWVQIGCGVLFLAALAWRIVSLRRHTDEHLTVFSSALLLGAAASLLGIMLLYLNFGAFRSIVTALVLTLLFFVYEVYPLDFFLFSIVISVGGMAASLAGSPAFGIARVHYVNIALAVIVLLSTGICSLIMFRLKRDKKIEIAGHKILLAPDARPAVVYAAGVAALLAVGGAILFGHILYFVAALCAIYLLVAIFYTVKLM